MRQDCCRINEWSLPRSVLTWLRSSFVCRSILFSRFCIYYIVFKICFANFTDKALKTKSFNHVLFLHITIFWIRKTSHQFRGTFLSFLYSRVHSLPTVQKCEYWNYQKNKHINSSSNIQHNLFDFIFIHYRTYKVAQNKPGKMFHRNILLGSFHIMSLNNKLCKCQ